MSRQPRKPGKQIRPRNTSKRPVDPVTAYAQSVVAGDTIAGPHVRNACRRHLQDLKDGPKRGLKWDLAAVERALGFFPDVLRLTGGDYEGRPFQLHPPQQFIVGSLFGWKQADGSRRFRRAYIEQAKGGGKSPLAAGVGLYMMTADGEARAEVYAAASKKDQAMVLFRDAVAMYEQSPALSARIQPSGKSPVWQLTDMPSKSFFKPLANEDGQSGPRPSCGLLDEIHEMKDRLMLTMIERGFKWRKQPLLIMITNSGHDRRSVCYEQHEHATRVAAGTPTPDDDFTYIGEVVDDTTFSYVCAIDKGDDPLEDESCWIKANPMLGVTMRAENLRAAVKQAKMLPGARNDTLRLNFCVWTDSETAWMSRQALEPCLASFDPLAEHEGKDAYIGLDLAAVQDLTGMAFCVETGTKACEQADGSVAHLPTYDAWVEGWTPLDTIRERAMRDRAPYDVWHQQGYLNATPGKLVRQDVVAARLAEIGQTLAIRQLAYDQYSFRPFKDRLDEAGLVVPCIHHPQGGQRKGAPPPEEIEEAKKRGLGPHDTGWPEGLWMPGSLATLEQLILEGRIRLQLNPILVSAFMSAAVQQDTLMGNRWLSKAKATNRIDVLIALLMAVGIATRKSGDQNQRSVYEDEDVFM